MKPFGRRQRRQARTLWSLAVLSLLCERDMHPYEMQRQMQVRHVAEMLALKRGSLYHAINQLHRDGLIEPVQTLREGRWPERTVYSVTSDGHEELVVWLRDLLSTPIREPSQFMAALAHVPHLTPRDVLQQLHLRATDLEATTAAMHAIERVVGQRYGRPAVLEVEYARALLEAELAWLRSIIDDLHSGRLSWTLMNINSDTEGSR